MVKDKLSFLKKIKEGTFTQQAKRAKMTVPQFTKYVLSNKSKFQEKTIKRAILAKTLKRF